MVESHFLRRQIELTAESRPFSFDLVQGSCFPAAINCAAAFITATTAAIAREACITTGFNSYLEDALVAATKFDSNLSRVEAMTANPEDGSSQDKQLY